MKIFDNYINRNTVEYFISVILKYFSLIHWYKDAKQTIDVSYRYIQYLSMRLNMYR